MFPDEWHHWMFLINPREFSLGIQSQAMPQRRFSESGILLP